MKKVLIVIVAMISYFGYRIYEVNSFKSVVDEGIYEPNDPTKPVEDVDVDFDLYVSFKGCVNFTHDISVEYGETIEDVINKNEGILSEYYSILEYDEIKREKIVVDEVIHIECKSKINVIGCIDEIEIYFEEGDRLVDYEDKLGLKSICSMIEYEAIKNDYLKDGKNIVLEEKIKIYLEGCINDVMYIESGENVFFNLMKREEELLCDYILMKEETNEFVTKDSFYYLPKKGKVTFESQKSEFEIYFSVDETLGDHEESIREIAECTVLFNEPMSTPLIDGTHHGIKCTITITLKGDLHPYCNGSEVLAEWGSKVGDEDFLSIISFCYIDEVDLSKLDLEYTMYEDCIFELYV